MDYDRENNINGIESQKGFDGAEHVGDDLFVIILVHLENTVD